MQTDFAGIRAADAIVSVVTVHLDAERSPTILQEIIESISSHYGELGGFISADVLVSLDEKKLALMSEWANIHSWAASRYDQRVGELLENCLDNSTALAFEIYYRKSHFVGEPPVSHADPLLVGDA
jgi:hypothetical protein